MDSKRPYTDITNNGNSRLASKTVYAILMSVVKVMD